MTTFTPQILRFDSLPSTNLEAARRAAEGASEGLCIVAREQTAGRGRLERQWISPKGAGIYFSILLTPQLDPKAWPLITLMASLAVHETLLEACALQTDIKWPNDILHNEKKLCGILAETVETPTGRAVVVGIGINLTSAAFPRELQEIVTSVESAAGKAPNLELVLQRFVTALESRYQQIQTPGGTAQIIAEWSSRSSYANGKQIRVSNGSHTLEGTTRGLQSDGALRIETETGEIKVVRAGDVTAVRSSY
ncbi:MAG: biotin--[acetyl-CoA-carboxylase] ligase [Pyrinomonadaceae bacterium]